MSNTKQPWVGLGQLTQEDEFRKTAERELPTHSLTEQVERADAAEMKSNRRDFLKMMGFGVGAATAAAACDIPRKYAIPYVVSPDAIVPGIATYYASSFVQGNDFCPILVKTREGRPIKIEGNSASGALGSGTTARAQAAVLGLYDTYRLQSPVRVTPGIEEGAAVTTEALTWDEVDLLVEREIPTSATVRIVTNTVHSPTLKAALAAFGRRYTNTEVVTYDTATSSALVQVHAEGFGERAVPGYRFDKADVVVSLDADFLGTWVFPSLFSEQYAKRRRVVNQLKPTMNRHYHVESTMTLTGSNADHRARVKPSHMGQATQELYNQVASLTGGRGAGATQLEDGAKEVIAAAARDLAAARGAALVVSGSNNVAEQRLVAGINQMLGAYGTTIEADRPIQLRAGVDADMRTLIADMQAGRVDAVIFHGDVNPAYDYPLREEFVAALLNVDRRISLSTSLNETAVLCDIVAPDHHVLESWGDAEPIRGVFTTIQPTIHPLWKTRQAGETFLRWGKAPEVNLRAELPYYEFMAKQWEDTLFASQNKFANFRTWFDSCLNGGVYEIAPGGVSAPVAPTFSTDFAGVRRPSPEGTMELAFFEDVAIGHGQYANNPWLQEVPCPVTRTTWGNYLQVPITYTGGNEYSVLNDLNGDELKGKTDQVTVTANGIAAPAFCVTQFGMAPDTVGIATGYGRTVTGKVGQGIGTDVTPWMTLDGDGNRQDYAVDVSVSEAEDEDDRFAIVQYHHTMGVTGVDDGEAIVVDEERTLFDGYGGLVDGYEGNLTDRSVINRADLSDLGHFTEELAETRAEFQVLNSHSLYEGHEDAFELGHHWGMYVDLNSCTGCSACVVACIAENNTPVVGKNEVARHHEMTWLRIDRYYYGDVENPQVVYQPMMCQHCDNAPCENVCPVAATNHSSEGLNQMTYNRCIGTRYCANNCPYKVRRFNWFDYTTADIFIGNEPGLNEGDVVVPVGGDMPFGADNLTRMVLNPDVTVRSRGVIEKCSFCVQRIQAGKLTAKQEGRRLRDSDVRTACQTACPTGAITFGDRNNKEGELMQLWNAPINYLVLEEVNVAPSVMYSAKISNRNTSLAPAPTIVEGDEQHG